jgi:hypothetical protein
VGCCRDGGGTDPAAADSVLGQRVQDPGEQAAAAETGEPGDVSEHLGLQGKAEGEGRRGDVFGGSALMVDAEQVSGVALEEDLQRRHPAGVAAGHGGEYAALGGQHGEAPTLLGEQGRGGL